MQSTNGIIRLNVLKADFEGVGGMLHRMHCGVHITVAGTTWKSGLAEKSGHECHWKDKHCDIESKHAGTVMRIEGIDYITKHDKIVSEQLIGFVDLGVGTFLVPCELAVEVFKQEDHKKKMGHITIRSEFIPIPV